MYCVHVHVLACVYVTYSVYTYACVVYHYMRETGVLTCVADKHFPAYMYMYVHTYTCMYMYRSCVRSCVVLCSFVLLCLSFFLSEYLSIHVQYMCMTCSTGMYIVWPLPSDQCFYRLITGYRMGGTNCQVANSARGSN